MPKTALFFLVSATVLTATIPATYAAQKETMECGTTYTAAQFPKSLPPLDKSACPSSDNAKKGKTLINQTFWMRSGNLKDFGKSYMLALKKSGWHVDKPISGHYKQIPAAEYYTLTANHPGGSTLKFSCTNLFRQPRTFDNNAKVEPAKGFDISVVLTSK